MTAEERYFPSTDFKIPRTSRFLFVITILLTVADIIYRKLNERALQPRIDQQIFNIHFPLYPPVLPPIAINFFTSYFILALFLCFFLAVKRYKKRNIKPLFGAVKIINFSFFALTVISSLTSSPSFYRTLFEQSVASSGYLYSPIILDLSVSLVGFIFSAGKLLALMSAINTLTPPSTASIFHIINTKYKGHIKKVI